jgi:hypothetical protein
MSRAKKTRTRKVRSKTMPVLGAAGVTFSLLAGGPTALAHPSLDNSPGARSDNLLLKDEEVSDVSLATFYAFDREDQGRAPRVRLAAGVGCAGCASCAGACAWGGSYYGYGPSPLFNQAYPPYGHNYRRSRKRTDETR